MSQPRPDGEPPRSELSRKIEVALLFVIGQLLIWGSTVWWPDIRNFMGLSDRMTTGNMVLLVIRLACIVYGWVLTLRVARYTWRAERLPGRRPKDQAPRK